MRALARILVALLATNPLCAQMTIGAGRKAPAPVSGVVTPANVSIGVLHGGSSTYSGFGAPSPAPTMWRSQAGERWKDVEATHGAYSSTFGNLDTWITNAVSLGVNPVYTFNTVPVWAHNLTGDNTTLDVSVAVTQADEPADIVTSQACIAPLSGTTTTNCFYKEYVTKLMQHVCPNWTTSIPRADCKIKVYEMWNEFNADNFWHNNGLGNAFTYGHLAIMADDATTIIRQYCSNCTIIAGSVAGSGDGGHSSTAASGTFNVASGQFLDAWHAIHGTYPFDAVSFHAYPSRTSVAPPPFPEIGFSVANGGQAADTTHSCRAADVPSVFCRSSIKAQPGLMRTMLNARGLTTMPMYSTEGSWNGNPTLTGSTTANTDLLRQAWTARWILTLASTEVVDNMWYQEDNQCFGTMQGSGAHDGNCASDPIIPSGATTVQTAWTTVHSWLSGSKMNSPGCQKDSSADPIYSCTFNKAGVQYRIMYLENDSSTTTTVDTTHYNTTDVLGITPAHVNTTTLSISPILMTPI